MSADNTSLESVLKLTSLHVDQMEYQRIGIPSVESGFSGNFISEMAINEDGSRTIRLSLVGECADYFKIVVRIVGVFIIEDANTNDTDFIEALFQKNTIAIMFPFLRSQVSLLTTQPGITPVLLPPMNISQFFTDESVQLD